MSDPPDWLGAFPSGQWCARKATLVRLPGVVVDTTATAGPDGLGVAAAFNSSHWVREAARAAGGPHGGVSPASVRPRGGTGAYFGPRTALEGFR